jgi:serine protease DegQ
VRMLSTLSAEIAGLAETAAPSVVRVEARRRWPASGLVWAAEGLVLAADHAVEQDEGIRIGLADGATVPASIVGRDPSTDIALLRAETGGLMPPAWADPQQARVGHLAVIVGRPGRTVRARLGLLSAVAAAWRAPSGAELEPYLEVSAGRAPGFSGGAVLDSAGAVLGMLTSGLARHAAVALPEPTLRRVAAGLLAYGRMRRGYLGIGAQPVRLPAGLRAPAGHAVGLLVLSVEPGSPAEKAGLFLGDVLLGIGDAPVRHPQDLIAALGADRIGVEVPVRILRGGAVQQIGVVVGERG